LTIKAPYLCTGNGYFAAWVGFAASLSGVGVTLARTRAAASSGLATLFLLAVCAGLVLIETAIILSRLQSNNYDSLIPPCGYTFNSNTKPAVIYALLISAISLIDVLILSLCRSYGPSGRKQLADLLTKLNSTVLFITWAVLAGWCTFAGPFQGTSNGYFASWGGVLGTTLLVLGAWASPTEGSARESAGISPDASSIRDVHIAHVESVATAGETGRNEAVERGPTAADEMA